MKARSEIISDKVRGTKNLDLRTILYQAKPSLRTSTIMVAFFKAIWWLYIFQCINIVKFPNLYYLSVTDIPYCTDILIFVISLYGEYFPILGVSFFNGTVLVFILDQQLVCPRWSLMRIFVRLHMNDRCPTLQFWHSVSLPGQIFSEVFSFYFWFIINTLRQFRLKYCSKSFTISFICPFSSLSYSAVLVSASCKRIRT